jgi:hypothetical protein
MRLRLCGYIKVKQNKRSAKARICRPIVFTPDCSNAYMTEANEELQTESGDCLIIN